MSRITLGFLLFAFTAYLASQVEPTPLAAQVGKKKKKDKDDPEPPPTDEKEDTARVTLTYDPGSHTRPISALRFSKDNTKLITVGWDYTIQIWSASTGERLDILRFPGYGREKGYDAHHWSKAAVSPDGSMVAVGGGPKNVADRVVPAPTRMILVDLTRRTVQRVPLEIGVGSVCSLEFSPDSQRLAIGLSGKDRRVLILDDVPKTLTAPKANGVYAGKVRQLAVECKNDPSELAFSPKGDRLAVADGGRDDSARISCWEAGIADAAAKPIVEFTAVGRTSAIAWSPDGTQIARCNQTENTERGVEIRDLSGKLLNSWLFTSMKPGFGSQTTVHSMCFLAKDKIFLSAHGGLGDKGGFGALAVILDPTNGKNVRVLSASSLKSYSANGAATSDGTLGVTATALGMEAVVYRLADGKVVAHCGNKTPIPWLVGWSNDAKKPAFYWNEGNDRGVVNTKASDLPYGFDLTKLEPQAEIDPKSVAVVRLSHESWSLAYNIGVGAVHDVHLRKDATDHARVLGGANSLTLIPNGSNPPLVAFGSRNPEVGSRAFLVDGNGKFVTEWLPSFSFYRDMASSPDGRFVITNTGTHRLAIFRTDGSRYPFLNLIRVNGEWVLWTAEGYYASSPGGEKLIGWAESNGANALVTFHTADKFAKQFRRPDIIKLAIEKGSVAEALKELKTKPPEIEEILPPKADLRVIKQIGPLTTLKASAVPGVKDKPIRSLQLLVDGRPFSEARGQLKVEPGKPAEMEWTINIPTGTHEVRAMARSDDGAAISEPMLLSGPRDVGDQPVLHRLCIGINDYDDAGLKLSAATKDATDVFAALEKYCVGSFNRYGAAKGQLLVDKEATQEAVLKALSAIRKAAKPGHLVVLYFAGHGVKQDDEFYLLTKEADTTKSLKGISLSGADLRKALEDMECPVLFIMDACHSAKGAKAFRPATDDLTRNLTDDKAGVTVLAAAMAHEVAMASSENGYFTAALLKALQGGEGVPFDPHERVLYTHHIYSVVFSEVRKATHGKQNPFLNTPWTVPPLAVREIAKP